MRFLSLFRLFGLFGLTLLSIPSLAIADDKSGKPAPKPAPPAAPAEVKATVDAFKGNWTFDAELTAPGMDKPAKFNCKAVAGNQAVSCDAKAKTPIGPFDALLVIAYDPYSKAVHFMAVSNQNEVHDHVCNWKGADLVCNPYKGGMGPAGDEITEDVAIKIEKTAATFSSVTKLKGGGQVKFEGKGKR